MGRVWPERTWRQRPVRKLQTMALWSSEEVAIRFSSTMTTRRTMSYAQGSKHPAVFSYGRMGPTCTSYRVSREQLDVRVGIVGGILKFGNPFSLEHAIYGEGACQRRRDGQRDARGGRTWSRGGLRKVDMFAHLGSLLGGKPKGAPDVLEHIMPM